MSARMQYAAEACERSMPGFAAAFAKASGFVPPPCMPTVVQAVRESFCEHGIVYVDAYTFAGDFGEGVRHGDQIIIPDTIVEGCATMTVKLGVPVAPGDRLVEIAGRVEKRKAALRTFRRAMRRHGERLARAGLGVSADVLRSARDKVIAGQELPERTMAALSLCPTSGFVFARAFEAFERFSRSR